MSKVINNFAFNSVRSRKSQYDWNKFFDGQIWLLEEGSDFECKRNSFMTLIRLAAKKMGKQVRIANRPEGIVLQAWSDVVVGLVDVNDEVAACEGYDDDVEQDEISILETTPSGGFIVPGVDDVVPLKPSKRKRTKSVASSLDA